MRGSLRSEEYIDEIIQQYSDMVYRLALSQTKNKADAEDVFQEVFMRLIAHAKPFDSEEQRKAWLIRVTINCSRKLFRSARFRRKAPLDRDMAMFDTPEKGEVYEAVMTLPTKYRTVIHLFYYEDLSIAQMSEMLAINESTLKSQLLRARRLLRQKMRGEFGDDE